MFRLDGKTYYYAFWFIAYDGFDFAGWVYRTEHGEVGGEYRFRYDDVQDDGKNRHWYEIAPREPGYVASPEEIKQIIRGMDVVFKLMITKDPPKIKDRVDLNSSDMGELLAKLADKPWFHLLAHGFEDEEILQ